MSLPTPKPRFRWRIVLLAVLCIAGIAAAAYLLWTPGKRFQDGRHDLRSNAIWIGHGWLGSDSWFRDNNRDKAAFRDPHQIQQLASRLRSHGIKYVFPHLCPTKVTGNIDTVDHDQVERFLDGFGDFQVMPWVGGSLDIHCSPDSARWRKLFVGSIVKLLGAHPRLAGVHINIEPMPSGRADFIILLQELRQALPAGKKISLAAYPPPTRWQRAPAVHWEQAYFSEVARNVDQLAVMMYDTGIPYQKAYQSLLADWTQQVLEWSPGTEVLLGLPAYEDSADYHKPSVENLSNSLQGVHAGLSRFVSLPASYRGIAIYCEWEMNDAKWEYLRTEFCRHVPTN